MSMVSRLDPSTREYRVFRRMAARRLFRQMLAHQGIDLTAAWRGCEEMIFRALRNCANCPAPESCRSWRAEKHPPGTYPSLCPNGALIEACRIILDPEAPSLERAGRSACSGEPAVAEVLADPIVQQLAASDRVKPLTRAPRSKGGILSELADLAGQFL